jgi:uracil-DNA glycosylase family 4
MTKQQRMDHLEREIRQNDICPDLAAQAKHLVMGDGNLDADIVFIGEAPGKDEDIEGLPFIGTSGKLLNKMLGEVGLQRADVYITNIVKYRPPDNRDPTAKEKAAFLPYLIEQLEIIDPRVIATLGRHSMEHFMPGVKISDIHGQPQTITLGEAQNEREVTLMPLYHPAAALMNGSLRLTLFDDFAKLPPLVARQKTLPKRG